MPLRAGSLQPPGLGGGTMSTVASEPDRGSLDALVSGAEPETSQVRGWVSAVVRHHGWRIADREAVVQDIMIRLIEIGRSGRFRGASSFRTFVNTIARNACIDVHRRESLRGRIETAEPAETWGVAATNPESDYMKKERLELLRYVVQKLSADCRRLWSWVYQERRSAREVAERLGIAEGSVRGRVHRCLNNARRIARDYVARPA